MITLKRYQPHDQAVWDEYVTHHPQGTLYHLSLWKRIIEKTYHHNTFYLMALKEAPLQSSESFNEAEIAGVLPLVQLKHPLFGNNLVSMPFADLGGILADNAETEMALLYEAQNLMRKLKMDTIELRHQTAMDWFSKPDIADKFKSDRQYFIKNFKVRMLLPLPENSESLKNSFKAKLRSQIAKPLKEGLTFKIGGIELLNDFYNVFCFNMRDLGSPVHSKKLMQHVLFEFGNNAKLIVVYLGKKPLAASLVIGFKDTLENPWSSALRKYSNLSPNMLLYWLMLKYGCDFGFQYFDFGRSTPGEGTYKFKQQWGAEPHTLHWHFVSTNGFTSDEESAEKAKFNHFVP